MNKSTTLCFFLTFFIANGAFAGAYKWENKENQVEYSQMPPPGNTPATEIAPPPPSPAEPTANNPIEEENQVEAEENQDKQQKALNDFNQEEALAKEHNCKEFQQYLTNLQLKERIRLIDANGNATMLTPEERDAEIQKAQDGIKQNCPPS